MNQTTNIDSTNIWVYPVAERNLTQAEGYDYLGRKNYFIEGKCGYESNRT